ncbi:MAG: thioredoxin family protein [Alphaproteobacteria bacterium]|nr:thioredoxin family protein [Alphaproteobacteria bacterium]
MKYDLAGTEFTINVALNDSYYLRQSRFAERASLFDTRSVKLNFGLIFLAFFGGLLLNFMPCVFPVLSLKIMAISQNLENSVALKRSLKFTICGIFLGFVIIICGVILAKVVGLSLGWGMQYQSVSFLVVMIFVITAFYILAPQLNFGSTIKYAGTDVLLGTLIVLLATPCTGPYLATAIGFALTGSYVDIVVLLSAVAVGLSVPYWVILALDNPQDMFPKPGAWMNKLSIILKLLLLATIGWFLVLIFEQTDIVCVIKICIILLVFALLCRFYGSFMRFLDDEAEKQIPTETAIFVRQKSKYVLLIVCALLLAVSVLIAHNAFEANYARRLQERQTAVDMPLIKNKLAQGRSVLLEIGADWCLTCHYNSAMVLTPKNLAYWKEFLHLDLVRVDWTDYNAQTLEFMAQYGRKGLPFYVLFTPLIREGIVLPEIFDADDIRHLLTTYH